MTAVSVVVPARNARAQVEACLTSLLTQSLRDLEVIVVDDASTDGSDQIVEAMAAQDPRLRSVRRERSGGAGAARNVGLAMARGEHVAFVDADDECEPEYAERLRVAAVAERADVVVCGYSHLTPHGVRATHAWGARIAARPSPWPPRARSARLAFTNPAPWNKLFRRAFLEAHALRFQETRSANDLAFTFSALALAGKVARVPEPLVRYRAASTGGISMSRGKDPDDLATALHRLDETITAHGKDAELRPASQALSAVAVLTFLNGCRTPDELARGAEVLRPFLAARGTTGSVLAGLPPRRAAELLALRVLGPGRYRAVWNAARGLATPG